MMAARAIDYRKGDHVGYVDLVRRLELPLPKAFLILRVVAGREAKVMKALDQIDLSAWYPRIVRSLDRSTGAEARKPHLGKTIVKPMIPGLLFIADFDAERMPDGLDYVEGWLRLGPDLATLSPDGMRKLVMIEAALNLPAAERDAAINRLIRLFSGNADRHIVIDQLVRITRGAFANHEGRVERLDSGGRLKVSIASLMSGVSVIVDEAQIEPVTQRNACATARRPVKRYR